MATSLDETHPLRGILQIVRWGVHTSYGIVRTDSSMAIHSLTYGGAVKNFPSLPIPISAMTGSTTVLLVRHRWNRDHVPVHSIRITEKIIYIVDR